MPKFVSTTLSFLSSALGSSLLAAVVCFPSGCESAEETFDNINSRVQCGKYCDKVDSCGDDNVDKNECVSDCRSSIEDECGNDNQAAANDKIDECADKGCTEFYVCMVFEAAPECFGFVD